MVLSRVYWILVLTISGVAVWYCLSGFFIRQNLINPYYRIVQDHDFPALRDKEINGINESYLEMFRYDNELRMKSFNKIQQLFESVLSEKSVSNQEAANFYKSFDSLRDSFCENQILSCSQRNHFASFCADNPYKDFITRNQNYSPEINWLYIRKLREHWTNEFWFDLDNIGYAESGSGFFQHYICREYNKEEACFYVYYGRALDKYWDIKVGNDYYFSFRSGWLNEYLSIPKSAIKDEQLHLTLIDTLTSERKEIVLDLFYSDNKF